MANNYRFRTYHSINRQLDERYQRLLKLERTPCKSVDIYIYICVCLRVLVDVERHAGSQSLNVCQVPLTRLLFSLAYLMLVHIEQR